LLENEKINLNSEVQQALIEKDFQLSQLAETKHEVDEAGRAYTQQLSLYNNGLSSIIELNTALDYYIQAQKDYVEANVGLMKSIINYSLVTNSFTALVQTLKL
jgi:outer membrane protein TolC